MVPSERMHRKIYDHMTFWMSNFIFNDQIQAKTVTSKTSTNVSDKNALPWIQIKNIF